MGVLRLARGLLLTVSVLLALAPSAHARAANVAAEYDVKAAFLFNFSQFVDWPPQAFADPQAPFVICVMGRDPFGRALDDVVRGERINGHPLEVQRHPQGAALKDCHILFIDNSARNSLPQILTTISDRPTLTVGDFDGFAHQGGMIGFVTVGQRIRLHVNLDSARAARLKISSKLLRPAQVLIGNPVAAENSP